MVNLPQISSTRSHDQACWGQDSTRECHHRVAITISVIFADDYRLLNVSRCDDCVCAYRRQGKYILLLQQCKKLFGGEGCRRHHGINPRSNVRARKKVGRGGDTVVVRVKSLASPPLLMLSMLFLRSNCGRCYTTNCDFFPGAHYITVLR